MQGPLEITFKDGTSTPEVEDLIRRKAEKLNKICDYMISCRIAVEQPQKHQSKGNPYRVRISMTIPPGHELIACEESSKGDMHDPLNVVIRKAFRTASRELKGLTSIQHRRTKLHPQQELMGVVHRFFPDQDYGFIKSIDSREDIYFHRNSVLHDDFNRMDVGTGVRFVTEQGEKGLQASTVAIVSTSGPRLTG